MQKKQLSLTIYRSHIYKLSGVETWVMNICQHLGEYYDITLLYDTADTKTLYACKKHVKTVERDKSRVYESDILLANYIDTIPDNVRADKVVAAVHSDYRYLKTVLNDNSAGNKCDAAVCVSDRSAISLKEKFGTDSIVIPNLLAKKVKTNKILHLVSFTRLTEEKGFNRMKILADKLREYGIKFDWKIFCESRGTIDKLGYKELIPMPVTADKYDYIADSDYLVQLSDTEAFGYSVHEALQYDTPVLVTDLEVFKDVVTDGYNGYKFKLDMSNIDVEKIVNHIPKRFVYADKSKDITKQWFEVLGEPVKVQSKKKRKKPKQVHLEVVKNYYDVELDRDMVKGERFFTDEDRAGKLISDDNNARMILCKEV